MVLEARSGVLLYLVAEGVWERKGPRWVWCGELIRRMETNLTMFASRLAVDTAFSFSRTCSSGSTISDNFVSASILMRICPEARNDQPRTDPCFDLEYSLLVPLRHEAHRYTALTFPGRPTHPVSVFLWL